MSLSHYLDLFGAESREHVATINRLLLALEADPSSREAIEGLFRSVHTVKGMSATLGFRGLADLTHEMESVLDALRSGRSAADVDLVDLLFDAADTLAAAVDEAVAGGEPTERIQRVVDRLQEVSSGSQRDDPLPVGRLLVRAMVAANASLPGVRAYLLVKKAMQLGSVDELIPDEEALQAGIPFDGIVRFQLAALEPMERVREALLSVGELASLELTPLTAEPPRLNAGPAAAEAAEQAPVRGFPHVERHVRIEAERLDVLMDQVGELVVLRDRLQRVARARGGGDLLEPVELAARLIGELRDEVMRIRMIPIAEVLDRFPRLVRDAARALDKRVDFVVEGSEIELDRSLLGRLGDPLVHLLRNAVDHGIESPAARIRAGKPELGTIRVRVGRERSRVLIRVSDDGRGIDRNRVLRTAVERGVVGNADAADLSDEELLGLVTRAGFSTADEVTDVSGRGVGLDVVATEVRSLGGSLTLESRPGEGTTFSLRLPVTVGILRAVLVSAAGESYAIPVAQVSETVELPKAEIHLARGRRVTIFRGEPIVVVRLCDLLGSDEFEPIDDIVPIVLIETGDDLVGIAVDELLGQQEIVVKPFDAPRDTLPYFSGATILSDGRPALILDASSVLHGFGTNVGSLSPVPVLS